jgi:hypothetical protein
MIQDWRLRKMGTPGYRSSNADRVGRLNDQLTKVFHPLTDRYSVNVIHRDIAEAAADFWGLIHAYNGDFQMIWPALGSPFDSAFHEVDMPSASPVEGVVSWVMEPGVRWKFPTGWRTCSKARVLLSE